ncbi:hypothetical protein MHYP_G00167080 [Metynnis hypsauchen]
MVKGQPLFMDTSSVHSSLSRMTKAVDRLRLLQFVLIQALLLTVCSSESDKNYVRCQNIIGTVGKPLTLTCEITSDPNCNCVKYKWKKNGIELKYDTDCKPNPTLNYPIQNPSMKDNGTFTFWVQLKCGSFEEHLSVILSEETPPAPQKHGEDGSGEMSLPQSPQEVEVLLGSLGYGVGVEGPENDTCVRNCLRNLYIGIICVVLLTTLAPIGLDTSSVHSSLSRMTKAVDRLRLLQFVLIQALLLTVCSSESDKNYVRCQNIIGTVGKPLTLTCEITSDPNCNCVLYKWKKNGIELKYDTDCKPNPTLNYPIQNPSMKDNGTFTFWVQLKCGSFEEHLSVILSEETPPAPQKLIAAVQEHGEDGSGEMSLPQSPQEVEVLLGSLGYGVGVEGPENDTCVRNCLRNLYIGIICVVLLTTLAPIGLDTSSIHSSLSRMTEAVDQLRLLQFVLIQALLLTVCSSESGENFVRCQNITGTVGKPLTLTCEIIGPSRCNSTLYIWKKNEIELKKDNDTDCKPNSALKYAIHNPSMKDNGTFTLFVQLKTGHIKGDLSVILSEAVTPPPPDSVAAASPGKTQEFVDNSARNHQVVVIFAALLTVLGLIGLAIFCRNHKTMISQRLNFDLCKKQNTLQGMV